MPFTRADVELLDKTEPSPDLAQWRVRIGGQEYVISAHDAFFALTYRPHPNTLALLPGTAHPDSHPADKLGDRTFGHDLDHEACIVRLILHLNAEAADPAIRAALMRRWTELDAMSKPALITVWHRTFPGRMSFPPIGRFSKQEIVSAIRDAEFPPPPCVYCGKHSQTTIHTCTHQNVIASVGI